MDAVQAPIVPIVGDIIRQVPGTISLGQGIVHYPPPRAAIDAARAALEGQVINEYQDGNGLRTLVDRLTKLKRQIDQRSQHRQTAGEVADRCEV